MNLQIEEGVRVYAKAQMEAQLPALADIPFDDTHFLGGSSALILPERDSVMIFQIPNDLEHICEELHIGVLEQSIKTPRLEAGPESEAQFVKHNNIVRAASNRKPPNGGVNGRVWYETAANIAALDAAVIAAAGYSISAWFWMESVTTDDEKDWIHVARIKLRLIEV
ncbi:MAG: hypothetical protein ACTSU8_05760 [Alphaproteobacteria bacterium]